MSAEDVRKLHSKFGVYDECLCTDDDLNGEGDDPPHHGGRPVVEIDDIGYTCTEPHTWICRECGTDDGEVYEDFDAYEWPCATIRALDR